MRYIEPDQVTAPRDRWRLHDVIMDGGASGVSIALGTWDGDRCLCIRWNGTDVEGKTLGNPQSSGHATWFVLPQALAAPVAQALAGLEASGPSQVRSEGLQSAFTWLQEKGLFPSDMYGEVNR